MSKPSVPLKILFFSLPLRKNGQSTRILAIAALLLLALIWGYNWIVMKLAVQDSPPFLFAALRAFLGAVALWGVMACRGDNFRPQHFWTSLGVGLLQSGAGMGLVTWALVHGGVGKTAILLYTMSFWTPLLSWWVLKDRLGRGQLGAIAIAMVGLALLLNPTALTPDWTSKGLATLAGLCWALSVVLTQWANRRRSIDLIPFTAWQMLWGSLPLLLVSGMLPSEPVHWTPRLVGALLYNAVPGSAIAWLLWLYALKNLSAGTAALGSLATPLLGTLLGWLQFGEVPSSAEASGMALLLIALLINATQALRSRSQEPEITPGPSEELTDTPLHKH